MDNKAAAEDIQQPAVAVAVVVVEAAWPTAAAAG